MTELSRTRHRPTDSSLVVVHSGPCSAGVSKIIFTVQNNGVIAQPFGLDFHTLTLQSPPMVWSLHCVEDVVAHAREATPVHLAHELVTDVQAPELLVIGAHHRVEARL